MFWTIWFRGPLVHAVKNDKRKATTLHHQVPIVVLYRNIYRGEDLMVT